jgi:hypothetical protein
MHKHIAPMPSHNVSNTHGDHIHPYECGSVTSETALGACLSFASALHHTPSTNQSTPPTLTMTCHLSRLWRFHKTTVILGIRGGA